MQGIDPYIYDVQHMDPFNSIIFTGKDSHLFFFTTGARKGIQADLDSLDDLELPTILSFPSCPNLHPITMWCH